MRSRVPSLIRNNMTCTCLCLTEGGPEGPHLDLGLHEILHHQVLHGDGLAVHLVHLRPVLVREARGDQDLVEQEHVQLLQREISS